MATECAIYAFCNNCTDSHPIGIVLTVPDDVVTDVAVGDLYDGREVPTSMATLTNNKFRCPKTRALFVQGDNRQIFLVPVKRAMKYTAPFMLVLTIDKPGEGKGPLAKRYDELWHARANRKALTDYSPGELVIHDATGQVVPDDVHG